MTQPLLTSKLFVPPPKIDLVPRPQLINRLDEGLQHKINLISAPAGFGKTTLAVEWLKELQSDKKNNVGWLSLDERDNDLVRFMTYFASAFNHINSGTTMIGAEVFNLLQTPQLPSVEIICTTILNELSETTKKMILVLDDYHLIESQPIHEAIIYLLDHLPPNVNLVITTRIDPPFPLAKLRARGELNEIRAADLRFTSSEAAEFLNQVMGLDLTAEDIVALETRTEGQIKFNEFCELGVFNRVYRK